MKLTKYKLGELIYELTRKNDDMKYGIEYVRGISNTKEIMSTKADVTTDVINKFYIIMPGEFIYNPRTTRMGDRVGLAYNNTESPLLFTFNNIAFAIREEAKKLILSDYLYIYYRRNEFDRHARINSWGSATELFTFEEMCDIEIELPPISIQQKYVDIYNAMIDNQKAYEQGLEELKLTCEIEIDKIKHSTYRQTLGELLEEINERNYNNTLKEVSGVNISKQFMPSVANLSNVDLRKYKVVPQNCFACNLMHVGRDETLPVALNNTGQSIMVSPAYFTLKVKSKDVIAQYIMMWLTRGEVNRYGWYLSDTSIRGGLALERFYEIEIPIPDLNIQKAIVEIYNAYLMRRDINERLKVQIRHICPILIKGSLEEAKKI